MALQSLFVKNYLLVEKLEVEFHNGLNVITGETGAGKSLIIGTFNIALGEKIDWDLMGNEEAEITLVFNMGEREKKALEEKNLETDDEMIIRRVLNPISRKSKIYINMVPVPQNFLKEITEYLIDLHGQHQHQRLLNTESHIDFVDGFACISEERETMQKLYTELLKARQKLEDTIKKEREAREKEEFYRFKLEELEKANLKEGEERELEDKINILSNVEKLQSLTSSSIYDLYESEDSAYEKIYRIINHLHELTSIDPRLKEPLQSLVELPEKIEEIWRILIEYRNNLALNTDELEELRNRLAFLKALKNKYKKTIEELIIEKELLKRELNMIENYKEEIVGLQSMITEIEEKANKQVQLLRTRRMEAKPKLEKSIQEELKDLGMESTEFIISISEAPELGPLGQDMIEFFISTNPGEPPRPLNKVASGGELSRIMLAIKRVLAEVDDVPTLVFDEADTGIGGKVAEKVGRKMKDISKRRQVIVITHLPQIAVFADRHFVVEKHIRKNKTTINIRELSREERISELARMLSGEKITDESLRYAENFLETARGGYGE
ncbi:MAG TPA: DNA repair protein RecN [Candidatus Hydrothermia bacterium]|nr:DNA repair protein RecN [Candidatus Hydrothermae bacterium]MDD3648786.1 DNA repair protein RecN [Candidatus Hydrothermia bacterium]HOK23291.1 DNA repair protein RecN [Candidatus Hydrothermia bacterium]HOL24100.1 DNA repair protein RecN [Candidatus Hydrothermia bacterium]HOP33026.1 DNA repair protein RecN [Candidatus Hydrothermia bacterium]